MEEQYILEQNKIATTGSWIWLMEITTTGYSVLRYTNDNAMAYANHFNVEWDGNTYWAMPFTMDDITTSTDGKFPEYKIYIGDTELNSTLRARIKATGGLVGSAIRLLIVHSDHLDLTTPAIDETAEILNCEVTAASITFTVGIPSLLSKRFPRDRYTPAFCRHKFGGALCKYRQPSYSLTSSLISFIPGVIGETGIQYNTIWASGGGLITNVFEHVAGLRRCTDNMAVNGDFENGTVGSLAGWTGGGYVNDWSVWGSTGGSIERRWSKGGYKYGSRSYYHIGYSSYGGIKQSIDVVPQTTYTVACWVYVQGGGANTLRLATAEVGGDSVSPTQVGAWEKLSLTVNVGTRSGLDVYIGGMGAAYFDAVSVVEGSVEGEYDRYALAKDTGFTVRGSQLNDGFFLANSHHRVGDKYVRVFMEGDGGRTFYEEGVGNEITITLGYDECDHTLDACSLRDNTQNFGGSPGIVGGIYG